MSRRKQAKPRPIFAYEEDGCGTGGIEDVFVPISHTNGHRHTVSVEDDRDDDGVFGEFAPLVMDTGSNQDDHISLSARETRSPSPHSIKLHKELPSTLRLPRPEPLKASLMAPLVLPIIPPNSSLNRSIPNLIPMVTSSPAMSTTSSISGSEHPSPATTPSTPSNMGDTGSEAGGNMMRRGTKIIELADAENDENLDYDSDFDDLEDLLSELIKHKILPVSDEDGEKFICPVCNISLLNLHDLTVHIRSHNTHASGSQSNSCKICGKILSSQSSLDRHMLVHSGERPFICKVCNMSFTTNGNMHRHSRIHTKEENLKSLGASPLQMRRGKAAWRQRVSNFLNQQKLVSPPPTSKPLNFQPNMAKDILKNLPNHSQHSVFGRPADMNIPQLPVAGMKRQFSGTDVATDWPVSFKRPTLESTDSERSSVSPQKSSQQATPIKTEQVDSDYQTEESPEREDKEVLHCPACPKTFLCKYGLESHVESHSNLSCHCALCNLTFKNPRKLRLHRLIAHTEKTDSKAESSQGGRETTTDNAQASELKVGFDDLTFVDFSVEKFPLIAKHYFEENTRGSSSAYLNFVCKLCSKAFPCESSLILHTYSHSKEKCTQCPICDCDYADVNEFHAHMLKHLSDKAFNDIRPSDKNEKGDEDLMPERLTKHDFLAMFLLKEEEDHTDPKPTTPLTTPKKESSKPIKMEKNQNNEYFAKLGQTFAQGIPPMFRHFPVFPPGYQPTLDDFHKMLQIATNMNMLPSMGPGLLTQGLSGQGQIPAHSSPSKLPHSSLLSHAGSATTPKPAHISPAKTPTLERSEALKFGGPEREINEIKKMNSGMLSCKYCDNTFSDYKALKSHIRSHQGLAPYQCNLCVYSSADKSSLIRHVRTHSGARPYQCLDCNFAFTTRANCERHLRKKHGKMDRDDVNKSVYLNKFALESSTNLDGFHSPDTVCKYCGVDFKYFRSLKNHLRSQRSSRQKPFLCHLCEIAFCTRSNCIRHVQKAHSEISGNQIENFIKFETFPVDDDTDSMCSDDGIPLFTEEMKYDYMFDGRSSNTTPQPPAAHSTPRSDSRHVSPNRLVSPMSHISPAPSPHIKKEAEERSCDTPLDFSMKQTGDSDSNSNQSEQKLGRTRSEETPMDLSVKKASHHIPIAPKPSMDHYQCMYCPMGYSEVCGLERHYRNAHDVCFTDNPTIAAQLSTLPVFNTEGKLLLPPKTGAGGIPMFGFNSNKAMLSGRQGKPLASKGVKSVSMASTIQGLQDKLKQKREQNVAGPEPDLASVSKMMNATDPLNFKAFFMPVKASDIPTPTSTTSTNSKTPSLSKFPNILKRPGIQISLEHCKAINRELDNLQREGDVDEAALSQVREMALSVKEEVVNATPTTGGVPITSATSPQSQALPPPETHIVEDENSEDGSNMSGGQSGGDKGDAPPKKKRNSYADSPHKLACPYCPRAFPWVSSLTRHLLTHTGQKPFKCPRCPVTFSTKSNRERHLIRKHGVNMLDPLSRQTMDRPYKCPLCVFSSFSTQSNLLKHYRDRHNGANLPDNIADIERMSPSAIRAATMEMEIRAAENPPQVDDPANMNLTTEEEEDDLDNSVCSSEKLDEDSISFTEMEKDDSMSEKSEKSDKTSSSSIPLIIADVLPSLPVTEAESAMRIAPHLLMAMPQLQQQKVKVEPGMEGMDMKMPEDTERSESPSTMKRNIERIIAEQKAIIEHKTHMEMKIQSEIRAHIEAQRKPEDVSVSPTPLVSERMDSPKMFDHNKPFTGSAERIINPERDNYDVDKITECWKCKENFPSRKVLVRHLKEHNIDLPFKCYLCDASYEARVDCLDHQADAHNSDWKILKEKNKVANIEQFSVHMDKVVENNCNKLDTGSILEIPGSGNDDSKMEMISADYMQRKVYCSLCPKRFWSLQDLRRHMRSHTGERPFECDICQKRFTLKHSMMRHRKKHIGAPPPSFDDEEDSNGGSDIASRNSSKPATSRNMPLYPYPSTFTLGSTIGGLSTSGPMSLSNTFLFSQGHSGGQMVVSGSSIGSLVPTTSTPSPSTSSSGTPAPSSSSQEKPAKDQKTAKVSSLAAVKKEFFDCDADMLHNLLGVESSAIEKMLDADVKTAAKYLGIPEVS